MNRPGHFFSIESAEQLFGLLKEVAKRFLLPGEKRPEDFLLLVFGLTHLREWIASDYDWRNRNPQTPEEHFFQEIYNLEDFKLLQGLCNRSKHMCVTEYAMGSLHKTVKPKDTNSSSTRRQLIGLSVNGNDMDDVILSVIKFYEDNWFSKHGNQ